MAEFLVAPYGGTLLQRQALRQPFVLLERWRFGISTEGGRTGKAGYTRTGKAGEEEEATLWLVEGKHHTMLPG